MEDKLEALYINLKRMARERFIKTPRPNRISMMTKAEAKEYGMALAYEVAAKQVKDILDANAALTGAEGVRVEGTVIRGD
jgi:hypothetical protein